MLHWNLLCPVCQLKDLREVLRNSTMSRLMEMLFLSHKVLQLSLWVWQWRTTPHPSICNAMASALCLAWLFLYQRQVNTAGAQGENEFPLFSSPLSSTFHKMKDFFMPMIYGRIEQAMANRNGSGCVPGIGHDPDMTKAEVHVWGFFQKPWGTLWGSQTFSHKLSLWATYLAATFSKLYSDFSLEHIPSQWPHSHQMNILASVLVCCMCEKDTRTVRVWTQAHKDDVTSILRLGTHRSYFLHKIF